VADKSLPSLLADAESEVAAAFKGILKILNGEVGGRNGKVERLALLKYPLGAVLARTERGGTILTRD
jgi:hypothetical protein